MQNKKYQIKTAEIKWQNQNLQTKTGKQKPQKKTKQAEATKYNPFTLTANIKLQIKVAKQYCKIVKQHKKLHI